MTYKLTTRHHHITDTMEMIEDDDRMIGESINFWHDQAFVSK